MIPHARPRFDDRFVRAVADVVRSGQVAEGGICRQLETEVCTRLQRTDAVAVDSGTSALMLALRGLQQQGEVHMVGIPAYACSSLWFAVRAAGCTPVLMDCAEDLRLHADKAWDVMPQLDAVIVVHPFGMVEPLIAESWTCPVIEDVAQAAGGMFQERALGSFGDVAVASFYATKPWGGAYGGMVLGDVGLCDEVRRMSHPDVDDMACTYVGHHQLSNVHAALALQRLQSAQYERTQRQQHMQWLDHLLPETWRNGIWGRQEGSACRYIVRMSEGADVWLERLQQAGIAAAKPVQKPLCMPDAVILEGAYSAWHDCVSLPVLVDMSMDEYEHYAQGVGACLS